MSSVRFRQHCELPAAQICAWLALAIATPTSASAVDFAPSWQPPRYEAIRSEVAGMLREAGVAEGIRRDVDRLWQTEGDSELPELDLIDRMAATCALLDGRAASLLERCQSHYTGPELPDATWLSGSDVPRTMRDNLRLYYARWLAQHALYDEALAQLAELDLGNVVDPASVLFYRAVAHQQLVEPDEARAALVELLEHRDSLPERFLQVAQLLERDLAALEDESMQHIARRMSDIRRRLAYGRAGEHVQRIERGVVESLDEKIEQLEQQQQQQNQSPSGGMMAPMQPMDDSRLPSMQAPMQVDQRDIGHRSGWGDLPPREREQALQAIGREFPAHYRDLIEQYFRELAAESPGADR